jgi:hypothetical protein
MIDQPGGNRQPDLLVRTTNSLDPTRIPTRIRTQVVSLLKLLHGAAHRGRRGAAAPGRR